ncbi:MAG TPA: hypothetical protein VMD91_09935 [Candidatus Sulfotelmatobacter sp.]|nr:hypothetical protein [Candidatus Sulfotelmatobacter sp.]
MRARLSALLALLLIASAIAPVRAARPLPDSGQWDRTFALYARDVSVPWKRISVRLDTYSGAPVDFAAYDVDPAEVLIAGGSRSRPLDTTHRTPVARWRFTPPAGQRYTPNDVDVPLQNHEGFFVIEARRGAAVQQTWLDVTRVGLLTKESPGGILLYGVDLGTGRALSGMRITYLVGNAFQYGKTDAHGIARWSGSQRPRFALAEWGRSKTFVSFLPQAPVPATLVGVRTDRGDVRAGDSLRVVGFARHRVGTAYRPAAGEARVSLLVRGRSLAAANAHLDAAGAFAVDLVVPGDAPAGDAAVLATVAGASGGAAVHVDGVGADVVLAIAPACGGPCPAASPIPIAITAKHPDGTPIAGRDVRVQVVRSPHVAAPGTPQNAGGWATTQIADLHVKTDAAGVAQATIPAPSDGLASTYGILATSGAASASGRVVTPTAPFALAVSAERAQLALDEPAAIDVRGFDAADGRPIAGLAVTVEIAHGPMQQEQHITLDAEGKGHAIFRNIVPGTNLVYARATVGAASALDVAAVTVAPQALLGDAGSQSSVETSIVTDKQRYTVGERVTVQASLSGAVGDAFIDLEGARSMGEQTVSASGGHAGASFVVPETVGDAAVGVAFVRDGALEFATHRIAIDGPGHARATTLTTAQTSYAPGAVAHVAIEDNGEHAGATLAIRLADARASGGASFEDAPQVLAGTGTTTQNPASPDPAWHGSVTPRSSTALDQAASERGEQSAQVLGAAAERALVWRIDRSDREGFDLTLPTDPGRYVVSVLKVSDDGDVGAATLALEVQ